MESNELGKTFILILKSSDINTENICAEIQTDGKQGKLKSSNFLDENGNGIDALAKRPLSFKLSNKNKYPERMKLYIKSFDKGLHRHITKNEDKIAQIVKEKQTPPAPRRVPRKQVLKIRNCDECLVFENEPKYIEKRKRGRPYKKFRGKISLCFEDKNKLNENIEP